MPKTKISEYSATANSNTDVASVNIDEGCAPSGINNAIRAVMGHLKDFQAGTAGDSFNGPVGTTTPAAGAFTTLSASSTLGVTGTATFSGAVVANGNATIGNADTDTITQAASYVTGTQLKSAKTATNTLNLAAYDVDGAAYTNLVTLTASNTPTLALTSTGVGTINNMSVGASTPSTGAFTTLSATGLVTVVKGSSNGITIGDVATNSNSVLRMQGTSAGKNWQIANNLNAAGLEFTPSTADGGTTYTTPAVTVLSSGNVGIGTSSPAFDSGSGLEIQRADVATLRLEDTLHSTALELKSANGAVAISGRGNYPLLFEVNGSERARIDPSGNLLVGATTAFGTSGLTFSAPDSSGCWSASTTSASRNHWRFYNTNGVVGAITTSGTSTTYTTSSDYRLKNTVAPMTGALARVAALKPVTYKWNADNSDGEGFIAHELQAVVPECVVGTKDAVETYLDEDGNEQTRPVYQGIDTSFLVATLTAAIQEQQAQIEQLTTRLAALEAK